MEMPKSRPPTLHSQCTTKMMLSGWKTLAWTTVNSHGAKVFIVDATKGQVAHSFAGWSEREAWDKALTVLAIDQDSPTPIEPEVAPIRPNLLAKFHS